MNRYTRIVANTFIFSLTSILFAQMTVSGTVTDAATGSALSGANVVVDGTDLGAAADADGGYTLSNVPNGATITASMIGYTDASATAGGTVNFALTSSAIEMSGLNVIANRVDAKSSYTFTDVNPEELDLRLGARGIPQALSLTPNVYVETNGGGYDDENMLVRGFTDNYTSYLINGVPVNDMENGNLYFSNWSVLADVGTSVQLQRGQSAVNLATPNVGGTVNFVSALPSQDASGKVKYLLGNGNHNKVTAMASTGLIMDGKGSIMIALGKRYADNYGNKDGTYSDAASYYLNGSYALNDKNRFEFITLGSPQRHGHAFYNSRVKNWDWEYAKELGDASATADDEYPGGQDYNFLYNTITPEAASKLGKTARADWMPFSGWNFKEADQQFDNAMISRHNYFFRPITTLNHYYKANDDLNIMTTLIHVGGEGGGSKRRGSGKYGDNGYDFTAMILENASAGMDSTGTALGLTGNLSTSILAGSRNNHYTYGVMSKATYTMNDNMNVTAGVDVRTAAIEHYRQVFDLLGGDYFFNDNNANHTGTQQYYKLGDKYDYDFTNNVDWAGGYMQADYSTGLLNTFVMGGYTTTSFKYENRMTNPFISVESGSASGNQLKAGVSYNLSDDLTVFANGGLQVLTPAFDKIIDDYAGELTKNYQNEKATIADFGSRFNLLGGNLRGSVNYYYTVWQDRQIRVGVDNIDANNDGYANITGLSQTHSGLEYSFAYRALTFLRLDLVGHFSNWEYAENVSATYIADAANPDSPEDYNLYIAGLKVGGAPQRQLNLITTFNQGPLVISAEVETSDNYYGSFDPTSRTSPGDEKTQAYKAPSRMVVNVHAAYTMAVSGYDVGVNLSVFNALNEKYLGLVQDSDGTIANAKAHMGLPMTWSLGLTLGF
ncbi:MAG: TonB-dependent receptor [Candidatus Marinimicrobia bacterium]|jgi:iron complex outermembrane recepter protein|nr:TonB-dependent receptor [Candidatus Neomarinimicrobiota bacterium]MBT3848537.1 TonB-dependent receptor [Candidatus Neomarinimicrobiota bacterium]MBT4662447.1 TonB-dependent receptor [Candidatus Neomarinimicrobiota bacterium]MBT4827670.1 TonB-dependent receptor [Candidatus Neomarinimicrobiota bacterium]MBT5224298.1 TonB-dependent receptor [Candidatus Neomarinimicrobiota bacterium]